MFSDFKLAALIKRDGEFELFRIPLHQTLQDELKSSWHQQFEAFQENVREVAFDPGYKPDEEERFVLEDYESPDWLSDEDTSTIQALSPISQDMEALWVTTALVGFAEIFRREQLVLFQNFTRSHVISPGRFMLLRNNTFGMESSPGITLGTKLAAVYYPGDQKLLFQNFRVTNTFLPLADFYKEASEQEILDVLGHDKLAPEDAAFIAENSNQWFRKRFAMLKDSGILDQYSAKQIQKRSGPYDVDVHLNDGKIVFPSEKGAARKLLQFLNEELFRGAITKRLFETNSKRIAEES